MISVKKLITITGVLFMLCGSCAFAHSHSLHEKASHNKPATSLGLQAAKRLVHADIAHYIPPRALGWGTWMVKKYKKTIALERTAKNSDQN